MTEIIKTLVQGKPVIDKDNNILYIKGLVLGTEFETINESQDFDLDELETLRIYVSKEAEEIDRLKSIIERQALEMQKLLTPKPRKSYKHLSKEEVREIAQFLKNKPEITNEEVANTYDSSQPVVSRIRTGTHPKL